MILRVFTLISRPSKQGLSTVALPVVAFACVTALLGIVLGGSQTFWDTNDDLAGFYQACVVIALALLLVPLVSLGAAAARLSARRRDDRLAALRLLGASGSTTAWLAILEAALVAFIGAIIGALGAFVASPLVGLISFRGAPLGFGGVALPVWGYAAIIVAVTLIATVSAVASLRRVIISPLGVALKAQAPKIPWLPALLAFVGIVLAALVMNNLQALGTEVGVIVAGIGITLTVALFAIDVIGAWFVGVLARGRAKRAQRPEQLLSARAILESPRAAWRQVSGVAMSSFMAVFAGSGIALIGLTEDAGQLSGPEQYMTGDLRTGLAVTVIGTFIMVACAVGVNQAAQILDRRDVHRSLGVMGTPLEVQDAARRGATILPLLLASLGSAAVAAVLLFPLVGGALIFAPLSLAVILGTVAVGFGIVVASLYATRPMLRTAALAA